MAKRTHQKKWSVNGALGSEIKIANGRFGTVQTKQKVKLNDFKTISYISAPIPASEFTELVDVWKSKPLARQRDSKLDIYNDDAYYMGYNGCTTNCPDEDVWKRREERPLNTTPITHVKETVLQNTWQEKKKRPLPEIPVEKCSLGNRSDQIDEIYIDIDLSTEQDSEVEFDCERVAQQKPCTEQVYLYDDTLQQDVNETFSGYTLNRNRNLTDRPPPDVPSHLSTNVYDKPFEDNLTTEKDSIFHRQKVGSIGTNVKSRFDEKDGAEHKLSTDHFYVQQDSCCAWQASTERSDEYLKAVTPSSACTIVKLTMPTITWATQRSSTENSEAGTRCTSASSSFINIDCCDNRAVETHQNSLDSPTVSTSSSFIKIEIEANGPERKEPNERPPQIPERPIVLTPSFLSDETLSDGTQRKEIWDDLYEDTFPPPIPPRCPIKSMDDAERRLLTIADQDESNDKCMVPRHIAKHEVTSRDWGPDDNISEERSASTLLQNVSKTDNPLENKLATLSVFAPSKEVNNNSIAELKIQDKLDHRVLGSSEQKTPGISNEVLVVDKEPLVNSSSEGVQEEIRRLRTKRKALVERNVVDKEMIVEQKVINDELRQSVNIKKQLAVLQREEHALVSALESIQKFGIEEDFKEEFDCPDEMSEIEEADNLYLTRIGQRNSFRRGFRRSRSGSVLSRRGRRSFHSIDSGISY